MLPVCIDAGAVPAFYVVLDAQNQFVKDFETCEEAAAFVARVNGEDAETVLTEARERVGVMSAYLDNLGRGTRTK